MSEPRIVWVTVGTNAHSNAYHLYKECQNAKHRVPTTEAHAEAAKMTLCVMCWKRERLDDGARRKAIARA